MDTISAMRPGHSACRRASAIPGRSEEEWDPRAERVDEAGLKSW